MTGSGALTSFPAEVSQPPCKTFLLPMACLISEDTRGPHSSTSILTAVYSWGFHGLSALSIVVHTRLAVFRRIDGVSLSKLILPCACSLFSAT